MYPNKTMSSGPPWYTWGIKAQLHGRGMVPSRHCGGALPVFGQQQRAEISRWCARRDSNPHDVTHCHLKAARLPIPPRALRKRPARMMPTRSMARDVTNREWGYKACGGADRLSRVGGFWQHPLDFHGDPV